MARFQKSIPTTKSPDKLGEAIRELLMVRGFKEQDTEPNLWRQGGFFRNPLYIQFAIAGGELKLTAWLQMVIVPGVYVGEHDLEGMFLIVNKRQLKKYIEEIERLV
jgi:hypothetical protein